VVQGADVQSAGAALKADAEQVGPEERVIAPIAVSVGTRVLPLAGTVVSSGVAATVLTVAPIAAIAGGEVYVGYKGVVQPLEHKAVEGGLASAAEPGSYAWHATHDALDAQIDARLAGDLRVGKELYGENYTLPVDYIQSTAAQMKTAAGAN
jgi:hypothetical protein